MVVQYGFSVFWETVGKIWETISVSRNTLKTLNACEERLGIDNSKLWDVFCSLIEVNFVYCIHLSLAPLYITLHDRVRASWTSP